MYSSIGNKDKAIGRSKGSGHETERPRRLFHGTVGKIYFHIGNIQFWYNDLDRASKTSRKSLLREQKWI